MAGVVAPKGTVVTALVAGVTVEVVEVLVVTVDGGGGLVWGWGWTVGTDGDNKSGIEYR